MESSERAAFQQVCPASCVVCSTGEQTFLPLQSKERGSLLGTCVVAETSSSAGDCEKLPPKLGVMTPVEIPECNYAS